MFFIDATMGDEDYEFLVALFLQHRDPRIERWNPKETVEDGRPTFRVLDSCERLQEERLIQRWNNLQTMA
jgi:hypothetical protein